MTFVIALAEADCRVKDTRLDYYSKVRVELDVDESGGNAASEGEAASGATVLAAVDAVVAKLSGDSPSHADEMRWQVHFTPVTGGEEGGVDVENRSLDLGLHLDTNNCRERRWLTFIIYLNTVAAGGHTVFPLAERSDIRARGRGDRMAPPHFPACTARSIQ